MKGPFQEINSLSFFPERSTRTLSCCLNFRSLFDLFQCALDFSPDFSNACCASMHEEIILSLSSDT